MTQTLNLSNDKPVVHIKAYGGLQITGVDTSEVSCETESPEVVTLLEEEGHVYVTANASCQLTLPISSSIEIEKGMGSIEINQNQNQISVEKVLGNLILQQVKTATVGKVGGNFSVRHATDLIAVGKVGGDLVVDSVGSFACEKIGGKCYCKDVQGDFILGKAGGGARAENITGNFLLNKLGGSLLANNVNIVENIATGGDIKIEAFKVKENAVSLKAGGDVVINLGELQECQEFSLKAGGDVSLKLNEGFEGAAFSLNSGSEKIRIFLDENDLVIREGRYEYKMGDTSRNIEIVAGGDITISGITNLEFIKEDVFGDLSDYFDYQESPYSELIQDRVRYATRKADAKIKAAQVRLEQIQEQVEKFRGFDDIDLDNLENIPNPSPEPPVPPVSRKPGKKGATDEERLMILKMLQEKKITVDEAETLFQSLEN